MASRYWVGNGGNWSDNANHWASTSGGAPGASKPTASDTVYFNASSFSSATQTVILDEDANCLSMIWTGVTNTPTLYIGDGRTLSINGTACTFIANMNVTMGASTIAMNVTATFAGVSKTTYNSLEIKDNAVVTITGSNTFQLLKINAGGTCKVTSATTQTITGLQCSGNSSVEKASLQAVTAGNAFYLTKAPDSGSITIEYASIKDCYASVGTTWTANKSIDATGNTNWIINALESKRYWGGGTGTWNSTSTTNWFESDRVTNALVPTALDDVIFDENSFTTSLQEVTIKADVYCNNLDFTGVTNNPNLNFFYDYIDLSVSGNVTLISNMTTEISYSTFMIRMLGDNKTFNGAGKEFPILSVEGTPITIVGNNSFFELRLASDSAKTVNFTSGSTQTITRLGVLGTSGNVISLRSTSEGSFYNIDCVIKVTFNYCSIKDCYNIGESQFTAYNSTDVSGNSGITFSAGSPTFGGFYFVQSKGSNFLNKLRYFASVSGGVGDKLTEPTETDDVFIDENSLYENITTMYIMSDNNFYCKNFDCTGLQYTITSITTVGNALYCYGDFIGNSNLVKIAAISAYFYMKATTSGHKFTTNGTIFEYVRFDGIGGEWTLQDNINDYTDASYIYFINGTVNTNDKNVSVKTTINVAAGATLNLGNSTIQASNYIVNSASTINAETSKLIMRSTTTATFNGGGQRYYDLEINTTTATIVGDNIFRDIKIASGKTVKFTAGSNTTVSSLSGTGVSGSLVTIKSTVDGSYYTITSTSAEIEANWYSIRDCHATGGATFYAYDSTDVSGNTGWNFNTGRYWVGNSGNWTDDYWSLTSGGAAGASKPTKYENVYFDANSFNGVGQTIALIGNIECRKLDFTGVANNPTLLMYAATLFQIYGSLTLVAGMTVDNTGYTGYIDFESLIRGRTITTGGKTLPDLAFSGLGGSYTLQDDLTCGDFYIWCGDIDTNDKTINCIDFTADDTQSRLLTLGASAINVSGNWDVTGNTNLILDCGTSTITMTGNTKTFDGNGKTFYKVELQGTPTIVAGDNIISELKLTADKTTQFTADSIQTIGTLSGNGTDGHLIIMESTSSGNEWYITSHTALNSVDYYSIKDSTVIGEGLFQAVDSTDVSGNTGWEFLFVPPVNAVVGTAIAEGISPSITAAIGITVNAVVGNCTADGIAPTVETTSGGNVTVETTVGEATADGVIPVIGTGMTVICVVGTATAEGTTHTITTSIILTAVTGNAIAVFPLPSMDSDATISAIACQATADGIVPTVILNINLIPTEANASALFIEPSLESGVTLAITSIGEAIAGMPTTGMEIWTGKFYQCWVSGTERDIKFTESEREVTLLEEERDLTITLLSISKNEVVI